jgi:hypothetical protein
MYFSIKKGNVILSLSRNRRGGYDRSCTAGWRFMMAIPNESVVSLPETILGEMKIAPYDNFISET